MNETWMECPTHGRLGNEAATHCYRCGRATRRTPIPYHRCQCGAEHSRYIPFFCTACGLPLRPNNLLSGFPCVNPMLIVFLLAVLWLLAFLLRKMGVLP